MLSSYVHSVHSNALKILFSEVKSIIVLLANKKAFRVAVAYSTVMTTIRINDQSTCKLIKREIAQTTVFITCIQFQVSIM